MPKTVGYPYTKPRRPVAAQYSTPGPIYGAPTLVGDIGHDFRSIHTKAPAYSFGLLTDPHDGPQSPGPAAYGPDTKLNYKGYDNQPKHSIGQVLDPFKKDLSPGPSDYDITPANNIVWTRAPTHAMATHHPQFIVNETPGPNAYELPPPDHVSGKPAAPKYSVAQYLNYDKSNEGPGPADYKVGTPDLILAASPKYTIATGAKMPESKLLTPSPAHYKHELVTSHLPGKPAYTMGIIHSPYEGISLKEPSMDDDNAYTCPPINSCRSPC